MPKPGQDRDGGMSTQLGIWNRRGEAVKEEQDQMEEVATQWVLERDS